MALSPLSVGRPVIDIKTGNPLQNLQLFSEDTARLVTITGAGSPEGIIEAKQCREYMDLTGVAGAIKYIKQLDDIGGNRTMGWVLI